MLTLEKQFEEARLKSLVNKADHKTLGDFYDQMIRLYITEKQVLVQMFFPEDQAITALVMSQELRHIKTVEKIKKKGELELRELCGNIIHEHLDLKLSFSEFIAQQNLATRAKLRINIINNLIRYD